MGANKDGDTSNAIGKRFGRMKSAMGFGPCFTASARRSARFSRMPASRIASRGGRSAISNDHSVRGKPGDLVPLHQGTDSRDRQDRPYVFPKALALDVESVRDQQRYLFEAHEIGEEFPSDRIIDERYVIKGQ